MKAEYIRPIAYMISDISTAKPFALEMSDDEFDNKDGWDAKRRVQDSEEEEEIPAEEEFVYGNLW